MEEQRQRRKRTARGEEVSPSRQEGRSSGMPPWRGIWGQQLAVPARVSSPSKSIERKKCNCKNSRCLKLYCECFAAGRYCDGCNCVDCHNNEEHASARDEAVANVLERNPNAFRPKVVEGEKHHKKGCNCKKSGCLKNYCECFQAGVLCTESCGCVGCKNFEGSPFKTALQYEGENTGTLPGTGETMRAARQSIASPVQLSPQKAPAPFVAPLQAALTLEQHNETRAMCVQDVVTPEVIEQVCTLLMLLADENLEKLQQSNEIVDGILSGNTELLSSLDVDQVTSFVEGLTLWSREQERIMDEEFVSTAKKICQTIDEKIAEKTRMFQMHQNMLIQSLLAQQQQGRLLRSPPRPLYMPNASGAPEQAPREQQQDETRPKDHR